MQTLIEIENLTFEYSNGRKALNNITVSIQKNERIAVVGSNGAGKSTFFLNLNGVYSKTSGSIRYRGQIITNKDKDLNKLRRNIGIVFQEPDNQIIAPTVYSEVSFGPMNLGLQINEVEKRVDEALIYMNISEFKDTPPHFLSGGEKKRVSIADIIAMKPEIIIFDEPSASLDPVNAKALEAVLAKLESEGITLIISTHDVDFAYRWADRVLVFDKGEIIADGTALEIFKNRAVIEQANLKKPMLLEICNILVEKNILNENVLQNTQPRNLNEFKRLFDN